MATIIVEGLGPTIPLIEEWGIKTQIQQHPEIRSRRSDSHPNLIGFFKDLKIWGKRGSEGLVVVRTDKALDIDLPIVQCGTGTLEKIDDVNFTLYCREDIVQNITIALNYITEGKSFDSYADLYDNPPESVGELDDGRERRERELREANAEFQRRMWDHQDRIRDLSNSIRDNMRVLRWLNNSTTIKESILKITHPLVKDLFIMNGYLYFTTPSLIMQATDGGRRKLGRIVGRLNFEEGTLQVRNLDHTRGSVVANAPHPHAVYNKESGWFEFCLGNYAEPLAQEFIKMDVEAVLDMALIILTTANHEDSAGANYERWPEVDDES